MEILRYSKNDGSPYMKVDENAQPDSAMQPCASSKDAQNHGLASTSISRRRLLQLGAGAGLAAVFTGRRHAIAGLTSSEATRFPKRPNIIVLMTDQERHHMHWPPGWTEKNLPALSRLKRHGLYFNRAYTAASQCSPSRALMMTGCFAPVNRVIQTFLWPGLIEKNRQPNIASLLKEKAGYEVVWKGKWHLSYAANAAPGNGGEEWSAADIGVMEQRYGWSGWNPPDGGNALERWQTTEFGKFDGLSTLGGGHADNDSRYVNGSSHHRQTPGFGESTVDFLKPRAPKLNKPFCLFVSLVNPHDVWVYPSAWQEAGYRRDAFANLGIALPPNYADDLSTKPKVHKASRDSFEKLSPLATAPARQEYVNFYAYLNTLADKHVGEVLDTLDETGLTDKTVVIRLADHGEGGAVARHAREVLYGLRRDDPHPADRP